MGRTFWIGSGLFVLAMAGSCLVPEGGFPRVLLTLAAALAGWQVSEEMEKMNMSMGRQLGLILLIVVMACGAAALIEKTLL